MSGARVDIDAYELHDVARVAKWGHDASIDVGPRIADGPGNDCASRRVGACTRGRRSARGRGRARGRARGKRSSARATHTHTHACTPSFARALAYGLTAIENDDDFFGSWVSGQPAARHLTAHPARQHVEPRAHIEQLKRRLYAGRRGPKIFRGTWVLGSSDLAGTVQ